MKVVIQADAERDIQLCARFWEKQCSGLGQEFMSFILAEIESLSWSAGIHKNVGHHHRMIVQGRFPYYSVFYRTVNGNVQIVALVDTRRDPALIAAFLKRRLD